MSAHDIDNLREVEKRTKVNRIKDTSAKQSYHSIKQSQKEFKRLQNKLSKIEGDIAILENNISTIDADLSDNEKYKTLTADSDFFKNYQVSKDSLDELMKEWEKLHELLEHLK